MSNASIAQALHTLDDTKLYLLHAASLKGDARAAYLTEQFRTAITDLVLANLAAELNWRVDTDTGRPLELTYNLYVTATPREQLSEDVRAGVYHDNIHKARHPDYVVPRRATPYPSSENSE